MSAYKLLLRPVLFRMEPERAHSLALRALEWLGSQPELQRVVARLFRWEDPRLEQELLGLRFKNPVGLAAGFDKDARAVGGLAALGFGFLEVGSVSARPSGGNPRPRLFRLPQDRALINRMGIPSEGADRVAARLRVLREQMVDTADSQKLPPVGVNLSFTTGPAAPQARAEVIEDFLYSFRSLYPWADYLVINLSCPSLPEVEFDPTEPEDLEALLRRLLEERGALNSADSPRAADTASSASKPKPLLIKLSPDLSEAELDRVLEVAQRYVDGIIAVNTTTAREGLSLRTRDQGLIAQAGGLSGAPLRGRATQVIAEIYRKTGGKLPIIGVGGIFTAEDAWEKLRAGASLVQVYTGLIYEGPGLIKRINRGLARLLEERGYCDISEAVGSGVS